MTHQPATVEESLRFTSGIPDSERDKVLSQLSPLNARLRSYKSGTVELRLFVKDRDTQSQRMTLEAQISGEATLVSTSKRATFTQALQEVRDDLIRQMTDARDKGEPRNKRR